MSCTPQIILAGTLNTAGNDCAGYSLLDATLAECVALRGAIDGTAPFWQDEANVGETSSIADWPCGCFYYNGGGGSHRLYYNVATNCGTGNDYRTHDGCGCSSIVYSPPPL